MTLRRRSCVGLWLCVGLACHGPCHGQEGQRRRCNAAVPVERRSRARVGKMKIVELKVLGRDFGSKVLEALRFVFKSYQPAVALSRESLRGPSWGDDGVVMERFARNLMDSGCVERAEDLSVLSDLLRFTHDILTAVLSKEKELKQYLPLQTQQEFSLNGPVSNIITSQHVTALLRLCASWSR